jgi:predicted ATPase/transcriptional regulator with XRE-family HTH domain
MDETAITGAWVRAHRQAQRLTQQAFADALDCSVNLVRNIERGRVALTPTLRARILAYFGPALDTPSAPAGASFAAWLPTRRRALDLTQAQLGQRVQCAATTIRQFERGSRRPSLAAAEALAEALAVPPAVRPAFVAWARGVAGACAPPPLSEPPPVRPAPPLPVPLTALIGRSQEIATLAGLLADVRWVTLTGPGGSGKTRLALAVAAAVQARYPAGVWWIPLAALTDPAEVLPALAAALGVVANGGSLEERLKSALRGPARLLVLDNFEQVAPAAEAVAALLTANAELRILVTRRAALQVCGEQEVPVPPLALPPAEERDLQTLAEVEAVRLFVSRARAVRPDFRLTAANAPLVAAICARLDGLPLAIELAAARSRLLSPAALLARLTESPALRVLASGGKDRPARQQTLHGAIAWSYALLAPAEQALFAALGIFHGGADLAAIAAVTGLPPAELELQIETLLQQNLLVAQRNSDGHLVRLGMLETIREFAVERLAERADAEHLAERYLTHYAGHAAVYRHAFAGPEQATVIAWWRQEAANLEAALTWGTTHDPVGAAELLWNLQNYWLTTAAWDVAERHIRAALAQPLPPPRRIPLLRMQCRHAAWRGEPATGEPAGREAVQLARTLGDPALLAGALAALAWALLNQGNHAEAEPFLREALVLARQVGNLYEVADRSINLGGCALYRDDIDAAVCWYQEALSVYRQQRFPQGMASSLMELGIAYLYADHLSHACEALQEAICLLEAVGNSGTLGTSYMWQAWVALRQGNPQAAAGWVRLSAGEQFGGRRPTLFGAFDVGAGLAIALAEWRTALLFLAYSQANADRSHPAYRRLRAPIEAAARRHLPPPVAAATVTLGQNLAEEAALAQLQQTLARFDLTILQRE